MRSTFLVLLLAVAAFADFQYEDGVVVLTTDTFNQALSEFDFALVEFYAPWCGHCKKLAPEYATAAQELAKTNPNVKLCKVDATIEKDLGSRFEVKGFPTLKFFIKGNSSPIPYEGGRTSREIINWLKKKTGPSSVEIKNVEDAEKTISDNEVVGFYFGSASSEAYSNFLAAATGFDDLTFVHSHDESVSKKYNVEGDGFILFKKFDEGQNVFSGTLTASSLRDFINAHRHPTVIPFDQKAAQRIFGEGLDVIFLVRGNNEAGASAEQAFRSVVDDLKGKLALSIAKIEDPMGSRLADYIGVSKDSLPTIRIVQPGTNNQKFTFDAEITGENIKTFVADFKAGKLKPFFKSEPIPENPHEENVRILVGKNFKEVVIDSQSDVLVEYYAPWCGHCKALAPIYATLATKLKSVDGLVIAKMDATANEVEGLSVQGFPTIKFYSKGRKNAPIDFSGERTESGFIDFLKKHSSVTLPEQSSQILDEL